MANILNNLHFILLQNQIKYYFFSYNTRFFPSALNKKIPIERLGFFIVSKLNKVVQTFILLY